VIAWRICKHAYSSRQAVLNGNGAREEAGRWNEPGLPLVYASETSSLALLETLVHASFALLPKSLVAIRIEIPDDAAVHEIAIADLPNNWFEIGNAQCVALGSAWIRQGRKLALRVPSATNPLERNILLNPAHAGIARCSVSRPIAVHFDDRFAPLFDVASARRRRSS